MRAQLRAEDQSESKKPGKTRNIGEALSSFSVPLLLVLLFLKLLNVLHDLWAMVAREGRSGFAFFSFPTMCPQDCMRESAPQNTTFNVNR